MVSEGVDGIEPAKIALQKAADSDQKYRVLLLDMWLHGKDASELVHFLHERPDLLGTTPRITPLHKGDSVLTARAVGDLEESESESGDEVLVTDTTVCKFIIFEATHEQSRVLVFWN